MKRLLFTALICVAATGVFAQDQKSDTTKTKKDTVSNKNDSDNWDDNYDHHHHHKSSPFSFGITFSRFDLGLATFVDNGSFTLSPQNNFLSYRSWKTTNIGFDLLQFGYRFNDGFKIYLSGGLDWTNYRLTQDVTILRDHPELTHTVDTIHYDKNRLSNFYLRIPLSFDFRTKEDSRGNRAHFVIGPDAGILLDATTQQKSHENGDQKFDDDFHFMKVRFGGFMRVGYAGFGFFAKYYWNDVFENSPQQKGLKNFSFGLNFGF